MHWVSKVVKATVGAAERRADIQHEWHIARKTNYIYDATFFGGYCEEFKNDAVVMFEKGDISSLF